MTRNEIIELAKQVGCATNQTMFGRTDYCVMTEFVLERFAQLVAASERDALAKSNADLCRELGNLKDGLEHYRNLWSEVCNSEQGLINERDALKADLEIAKEAQRCECSADQACQFARERDALRSELADAKLVALDNANWFDALKVDYDALKAKLAELQAQEPIGYVYTHNGLAQGALNSKSMPAGTPLYRAASAKEKTE